MAENDKPSGGKPSPKLIFACSGAADVGEISDKAARKLTRDGLGKMFCLAGIGGRVEPIINAGKSASLLLAIDGCELDCAKNCLEKAGFENFQHLRITDMGMEKGKSPATDERVAEVADIVKDLLNNG
ncbi:MAG TPA: putative zinc-binding protein [Sedimentisphaerales bacterium]|nr:putative zinc-binding protein [Sedimentisphaerales bacterium]